MSILEQETEIKKEVKTVVIGKTYSNNDLLAKSGEHNAKTEEIVKHYFPFIIDRIIQAITKTGPLYLPSSFTKYPFNEHSHWNYTLEQKYSEHKYAFALNIHHNESSYNCISINMNESGNCCGSMFLHNTAINLLCLQQKDISKLLLAMQEDIAIAQKTTHLLGIHIEHRTFTKKLVEKYGWTKIDEFVNRNSGNNCWVMSKKLPSKFEEKEILGKELN